MSKKTDNGTYKWEYCSLGGVVRVKIASGEDIAHLGELDQKLWTALSCPVKGLEFDATTLQMLDTDGDGKIRVAEVVAAAEWLTSVIKDKDLILKGDAAIPLNQIKQEDEKGAKLYASAKQILSNLGLEKDEISVADTSDSVAIFAKTRFNGDGIITPESTDEEDLKQLITNIVEKIGSQQDRSGVAGVNADLIEQFYAACADYASWQQQAADAPGEIFPYGDDTPAAFAACEALKDKIADYFMRCKLIAFDADVSDAVDVSVEKINAISEFNLATQSDEIAKYPLARPSATLSLAFDAINPAWQDAFAALKKLVLDVDFAGKTFITEAEWQATLARFGAYTDWVAARKGAAVESLGLDAVKAVLAGDRKAALLDLVAQDKALESEAAAIDEVNRLTHLYRDFYTFLRNYVIFLDFYSDKPEDSAMFEAGKLYIDQRCCNLCVRVEDLGKHADMAGLSGMFLIYCACTSKVRNESMNIVAVMTNGNTRRLRPGKNAVFYDRSGQDWDAVVTKIVDNPISVRQAFWSPYRKFANAISERINKSAEEKDNKVMNDMTAKANAIDVPAEGTKPEPKPPFDIAKFAGIAAAIGMAIGAIGLALSGLIKAVAGLTWWKWLIIIAVIMLLISGPACFIAWNKLRKRNLGPVLNANGWAINAVVLINIAFGATLTSVAKYPRMNLDDPYARRAPLWWRILRTIIILAVIAFVLLCATQRMDLIGLGQPSWWPDCLTF